MIYRSVSNVSVVEKCADVAEQCNPKANLSCITYQVIVALGILKHLDLGYVFESLCVVYLGGAHIYLQRCQNELNVHYNK